MKFMLVKKINSAVPITMSSLTANFDLKAYRFINTNIRLDSTESTMKISR